MKAGWHTRTSHVERLKVGKRVCPAVSRLVMTLTMCFVPLKEANEPSLKTRRALEMWFIEPFHSGCFPKIYGEKCSVEF